jgi:hypothetical protein
MAASLHERICALCCVAYFSFATIAIAMGACGSALTAAERALIAFLTLVILTQAVTGLKTARMSSEGRQALRCSLELAHARVAAAEQKVADLRSDVLCALEARSQAEQRASEAEAKLSESEDMLHELVASSKEEREFA